MVSQTFASIMQIAGAIGTVLFAILSIWHPMFGIATAVSMLVHYQGDSIVKLVTTPSGAQFQEAMKQFVYIRPAMAFVGGMIMLSFGFFLPHAWQKVIYFFGFAFWLVGTITYLDIYTGDGKDKLPGF